MRTAILYVSKHGTTEKVARLIADKLEGASEVELVSLKENVNPDISGFETVILGSSVYAGSISKKMKAFCKVNESALLRKNIGLFVCGMHPDKEEREKELKEAYPDALREKAVATGFLGGEFLFEQMNFVERLVIWKIAKIKRTLHRIDQDAIHDFVKKLR